MKKTYISPVTEVLYVNIKEGFMDSVASLQKTTESEGTGWDDDFVKEEDDNTAGFWDEN